MKKNFSKAAAKDPLPVWDLAKLYPAPDSAEIRKDKARVEMLTESMAARAKGRVAGLPPAELKEVLDTASAIEALVGKITLYSDIMPAQDSDNFPKITPLRDWLSEMKGRRSFLKREIGEIREENFVTLLAAPELSHYAPWLARVWKTRKHIPGPGMEALKRSYGENMKALQRLRRETVEDLRVETPRDGALTLDELEDRINADDTSPQKAASFIPRMEDALKGVGRKAALLYDAMMQDRIVNAGAFGFSHVEEKDDLEHGITAEVADVMSATLRPAFPKLSHRYYKWHWDREAPDYAAKKYGWSEAKDIVLTAFSDFSPRFARIAEGFFDGGYIDAKPRPRKEEGAFAQQASAGNHPYIHLNFAGEVGDVVSALGHELGHGIHFVLSDKAQGPILDEATTVVCETASLFAEMLVFDEILKREKNPARRRGMLEDRVSDLIHTSLNQFSWHEFEMEAHQERKKGEVGAPRLSALWNKAQKRYYGPSTKLESYDRYDWIRTPHLFDHPFYVQTYTFSQMAANALYRRYKEAERQGPAHKKEFVSNYMTFLEAGGSKDVQELFRPFGMDPAQPAFWKEGLAFLSEQLDQLEKTDKKPARAQAKRARG